MPLFPAAPVAQSWQPSDNGLLGANFALPGVTFNDTALTAGTLYLAKLNIRVAVTITNLLLYQGTTGVGTSTGTYVGLYSSSGTKLTGSSDQVANFTGYGNPFVLTTPQAVAAGSFVWAAVLVNLSSSQPKLLSGYQENAGIGNTGLTAATYMFADNGTGLSSLPSSITPASNDSGSAYPFWVGFDSMALNTVTLTWDLADLIESGVSATISLVPTAVLTDSTDHVVIPEVTRSRVFTGGTGSLPGIIACDNGAISPAGWAYTITVTLANGTVLLSFSAFINHANGSTQDLSTLTPAESVTAMAEYMPLPSGTAAAGAVPVATGQGNATAWSTGVLMDETGGLIS